MSCYWGKGYMGIVRVRKDVTLLRERGHGYSDGM